MPREYQPASGTRLLFKSTTEIAYDKERDKSNLNRDSFYVTTMPKTIKQLLPSNIYLNYMNLCGLVWIDPSVTEEVMHSKGFVRINVDKNYLHNKGYDIPEVPEYEEGLQYIENITHNKFVIQLSEKSDYFNLYVPVNSRYIGKYDEVTNNTIIELLSGNNYIADMRIRITGTTIPDEESEDEPETVIFTSDNYELYSDTILVSSGNSLVIQSGLSPIKLKDLPNGNYKIVAINTPETYYPIEDIEFSFVDGLITIDDTVLGVNRIVLNYELILSTLITDNLIVNLDASDLTNISTTWENRINQYNTTFTFGNVTTSDIYNVNNTLPKLPIITGTSYVPNTSLEGNNVDLVNNNTMYVYFSIYLTKLSDIIKYTGTNYNLSGLASHIEMGVENSTDYLKPMYTVINDNVVSNLDYSTRSLRYNNLDIDMSLSQIADTNKILLTLTVGSDNNDKGIYIYNAGEAESVDETHSIYDIELDYTFDSVTGDIIFTDPEPINIFMFNRIIDNIKTFDIYVDTESVFISDVNFTLTNTDTNLDLFYTLQEHTGYNLQTFGAAYIHSIKLYNKVLTRKEMEQDIRYERKITRTFDIINEPVYLDLSDKSWTTGALDTIYTDNRPFHFYEYFNISRFVGTNTKIAFKLLHSVEKPFVKYQVKCYCYDKHCNILSDLSNVLHYNIFKNTMELIIVPSTFNESARYLRFGFELIEDAERNGTLSSILPDFSMLYVYNPVINPNDNEIFFDDRVQLPILYNPFDEAGSYGDHILYGTILEDTSDALNTSSYSITSYIGNKIKHTPNADTYYYDSQEPSLADYKLAIANIVSNRVTGVDENIDNATITYSFVADIEQYFKYHNTVNAVKLVRGNHLLDNDCLGYRYKMFFFDANGNYLHNDTYSSTYGSWYTATDYIMLPYDKTNIKYIAFWETIYVKDSTIFNSRYSDMTNCASTLWNSLYDVVDNEHTLKPLPNNMTANDVELIVVSDNSYNGNYANLINCFEKHEINFFTV